MPAVIELYSKPGCYLCEVAKKQIGSLKGEYDFTLIEIDILQDKELFKKYSESIPVILVNGAFFSKFEANLDKLRLLLTGQN